MHYTNYIKATHTNIHTYTHDTHSVLPIRQYRIEYIPNDVFYFIFGLFSFCSYLSFLVWMIADHEMASLVNLFILVRNAFCHINKCRVSSDLIFCFQMNQLKEKKKIVQIAVRMQFGITSNKLTNSLGLTMV